MKAPEKIHIQPNAHDRWFEGNIPNCFPNGLFVEYTRTDAFIARTEDFFYEKLNSGEMECGDIVMFISDFKKYLKC